MSKKNVQAVEESVNAMTDFERQILDQIQGWDTVETGFAPYWKAELGKCLVAKFVACDARDERFPRYILQATRVAIECQRGPVDDAEFVTVQPGEFFTMTVYAGLDMERYLDLEMFIKIKGERKLPGNDASGGKPRTLYEFDVRCSPEDKKKINALRAQDMQLLMARRTIGGVSQALTTA